jgi:2-polyprenyl-6-methoxyphenol hydroxylase-like FAD-dependent oxidoreductase
MPYEQAIIIGGGIAGVAAAIALTRHTGMAVSIFEIRTEPATIGGAINLTPNALRYLDHLGALARLQPKGCEVKFIEIFSQRTGKSLGKINFDNIEKFKYRALRVMRNELHRALLETLEELGVRVQYGKKIQSVSENKDKIVATFEDGDTVSGDILLGCDGIHSTVRMKFVEPDRKPVYTGIANAYGFLDTADIQDKLPVEASSLYSGRSGSMLLTYANAAKSRLYVAAVMGSEDVGSREGWVVKGQDQDFIKKELLRRFSGPALPFVSPVVERVESVTFYPVYKLSDGGKWNSGRIILLGDAAHAMPPQGESVGLALEDVILLSRLLSERKDAPIDHIFKKYEDIHRGRINAAVNAANFGFETIKDRSWFMTFLLELVTWLFLTLTAARKEREFAYDVRDVELSEG